MRIKFLTLCIGVNWWMICISQIWEYGTQLPGWFLVQQAGWKVTNFWSDTWDVLTQMWYFPMDLFMQNFKTLRIIIFLHFSFLCLPQSTQILQHYADVLVNFALGGGRYQTRRCHAPLCARMRVQCSNRSTMLSSSLVDILSSILFLTDFREVFSSQMMSK